MREKKSAIRFLLPFLVASLPAWSQEVSFASMQALTEWRWGVIAYNDNLPGKSLLAMERAVSLNPTDPRIKEWLGWAYWKSGMEGPALKLWDELIERNEATVSLKDRVEWFHRRLDGHNATEMEDEWIPLAKFQGGEGLWQDFKQPSTARSLGDHSGSLIVSSYSGGELIQIDANGAVVEHFEGGIEGLLRPFDIIPISDNRLLVSEFQADRLALIAMEGLTKGYRITTWGQSGREMNQFLGPQFMALSPDEQFVYVSDWGNRRVVKWSMDGSHILSYTGFQGPSGIACQGDKVYIADSLQARIDVFDSSGNSLGPLLIEGLDRPEGLAIQGNTLLIADGARIMQVDLISGELSLKASLGDGVHRITSVFPDDNGNLVVCDFNANRVLLLTPLSTLYSGLDVDFVVRADAFPNVYADLTVKDRNGTPITGLDTTNFRIFDGETLIEEPSIDWQSHKDSSVSIIAVVDTAGSSKDVMNLLRGVEDISETLMTGDEISFVEASTRSTLYEFQEGKGFEDFSRSIISEAGLKRIQWDESLRLAAHQIAPERMRKAIVAFIHTPPATNAFETFGLVETARLMVNNGIVFYPVYANSDKISSELDYIAQETKGRSFVLFQPEGSDIIVDALRHTQIGRYTIAWKSQRSSGFGRDYLPVSVEAVYYSKSGYAESGTFAPLR